MLEPAIRKHVTNACSYKLFILSEVFGCSFELRTIRLFPVPFFRPYTQVSILHTHVLTHGCVYMYNVRLCMHVCTL